jgi:hypothetical protein
MPEMTRPSRPLLVLALPLAMALTLGACKKSGSQGDLDSLDKELTDANGAGKDPALTASLRDQITVDPALAQSSNAKAVRPPSRPDPRAMPPEQLGAPADTSASAGLPAPPAASGNCPGCKTRRQAVTLGALAERGGEQGMAACANGIRYASGWALRLPAALPLYPDARVSEAAGKDGGGCTLRVVSFASNAPVGRVINWYYAHATKGGYSAEHQADGADHVLAGARGDAAYVVYLSPRQGGGTSVDVVSNGG